MHHRIMKIFRALRRDKRGNVAVLAALAMPVVLGSLGVGAEVASWYSGKRSLQSAADSAAIAAATNGGAGFDREARAVAARYGFHDGADGVAVTPLDKQPCPAGGNDCYSVTITKAQPLLLAQIVGFQGDTRLNGSPAQLLKAKAVAIQVSGPRPYCILALAGSGAAEGIRANGSPDADLTGCRIMSNTNSNCNGHTLLAEQGDAHGTPDYCGRKNTGKVPVVSDPYADLRANIPSDGCGGTYYKAPTKKSDPSLPSANMLLGIENRTVIDICGDVWLNGPVILQSNANTVLIIRNGTLDLRGYTLQANAGSALTIVFTGNASGRSHIPIGDGGFDFRAPTTGPWKGVAIYQDPQTTSGVDFNFAGNSPTWDITGLVYAPKAAVGFSGIINKATNGASCFGLVIDHLLVNGTAKILAHGECPAAGLVLPYSQQAGRGELVS